MKIKSLSQEVFNFRILLSYDRVDFEYILCYSAHFLHLFLKFIIMTIPFLKASDSGFYMSNFLYDSFISLINFSLFLLDFVLVEESGLFLVFFLLFGSFRHNFDHSFTKPDAFQNFIQSLIFLVPKLGDLLLIFCVLIETKIKFMIIFFGNVHGFARLKQKPIMILLIFKFKQHASPTVTSKITIHQLYFYQVRQIDNHGIEFICQLHCIYISILPMSQITASRMNMQLYKQKIAAAKKGHELLKRKADALKKKFKQIMKALLESKQNMGKECKQAFFLIAEAKYAAGQFQGKVVQAVKKASIKLDKSEQNIAGVLIPSLSVRDNREAEDNDNGMSQIGLDRGGVSIQNCRQKFRQILTALVEIASLQASFLTLDEKIKVTNRRVNALEHVVIPRFINIYRYIDQELDEQAREDFFRLKKVLDNKKKHNEQEDAIKEKELGTTHEQIESQNLLDDADDDIIF